MKPNNSQAIHSSQQESLLPLHEAAVQQQTEGCRAASITPTHLWQWAVLGGPALRLGLIIHHVKPYHLGPAAAAAQEAAAAAIAAAQETAQEAAQGAAAVCGPQQQVSSSRAEGEHGAGICLCGMVWPCLHQVCHPHHHHHNRCHHHHHCCHRTATKPAPPRPAASPPCLLQGPPQLHQHTLTCDRKQCSCGWLAGLTVTSNRGRKMFSSI
jgi:hypothetical protein